MIFDIFHVKTMSQETLSNNEMSRWGVTSRWTFVGSALVLFMYFFQLLVRFVNIEKTTTKLYAEGYQCVCVTDLCAWESHFTVAYSRSLIATFLFFRLPRLHTFYIVFLKSKYCSVKCVFWLHFFFWRHYRYRICNVNSLVLACRLAVMMWKQKKDCNMMCLNVFDQYWPMWNNLVWTLKSEHGKLWPRARLYYSVYCFVAGHFAVIDRKELTHNVRG